VGDAPLPLRTAAHWSHRSTPRCALLEEITREALNGDAPEGAVAQQVADAGYADSRVIERRWAAPAQLGVGRRA
jgi:hypothetical protein